MKIKEINLNLVYKSLEKILGTYSYIVTDLIKTCKKVDKKSKYYDFIQTLAIDKDGTLYINEEFCQDFVDDEEQLTVLFLHEIFHAVLADTRFIHNIPKEDKEYKLKQMAANISMDCRINSILGILYRKIHAKENIKKIYKNIYNKLYEAMSEEQRLTSEEPPIHRLLYNSEDNLPAIEKEFGPRITSLYKKITSSNYICDFSELYFELIDYFRKNSKESDECQVLIGSHGEGTGSGSGNGIKLSPEQQEKVREAISNAIRNEEIKNSKGNINQEGGRGSSSSNNSYLKIIPEIEGYEEKKIDRMLLKKLSVRSITHNILMSARKKVGKWTTSPVIPAHFSKCDIIKVICDIPVPLWRHKKYVTKFEPNLVPIYFDVSGSMDQYIPKILDLILNMDDRIEHIWCFSTFVERHTVDQLEKREISTSGGTDFQIVVDHAIQNNFTDIMVITDGYGYVKVPEDRHPSINSVCTILVPNSNTSNWFSKVYENSHDLEKVITT